MECMSPQTGICVTVMLTEYVTHLSPIQLPRPSTSWRAQQAQRPMCQAADRRFDLVTTDVDGTLLSSKNELSPRNEEAIAECIKLGIPVSAFGASSVQLQMHLCRNVAHQAGWHMPALSIRIYAVSFASLWTSQCTLSADTLLSVTRIIVITRHSG